MKCPFCDSEMLEGDLRYHITFDHKMDLHPEERGATNSLKALVSVLLFLLTHPIGQSIVGIIGFVLLMYFAFKAGVWR